MAQETPTNQTFVGTGVKSQHESCGFKWAGVYKYMPMKKNYVRTSVAKSLPRRKAANSRLDFTLGDQKEVNDGQRWSVPVSGNRHNFLNLN